MSAVLTPTAGRQPQAERVERQGRTWRSVLAVGAAVTVVYLAIAVVIEWQVWSGHPTSDMSCGCGDPALFVWSFGWVAHAVAHGQNPFFSHAIFHPDGVNLLANATAPLFGFVLAPVTWIFGPIAAVNVANTLAPALGGVSTYWATRRTLRLVRPAALVAGAIVELSPEVVGNAAVAHLMMGMVAFVPIIGVCIHELFVRQSGPPWRWGLILAATLIGQFFSGTELLAIVGIVGGLMIISSLAVIAWLAIRGSASAMARGRHAVTGLAVTAAVTGVALAYPAWFALAGPRHINGPPWPDVVGTVLSSASPHRFVSVLGAGQAGGLYQLAGYFGPVRVSNEYLGVGALVVAALAVVVLWRRSATWVLAAIGLGSAWLSLGTAPGGSVPIRPWALFVHLPVVVGLMPTNFNVVTVIAVAGLVGLFVDRVWRLGRGRMRIASAAVAAALAAVVIAPLATAWPLPLTATHVSVPAWFTTTAPTLPADSVVLAIPFAGPPGYSRPMVWQSVGGMHVAIVGGCCIVPGPDGKVDHFPDPHSANRILGALSLPPWLGGPLPEPTPANFDVVRQAMAADGVTTVVVTDLGRDPAYAVRWFTGLFGRPPTIQNGAHVWTVDRVTDLRSPGQPLA